MKKTNFILLNSTDNVLVCVQAVEAGGLVMIDEQNYKMTIRINVGHKIARKCIKKSQKIIKHGVFIGSAITDVVTGEHVHLHNMKSDYIPSHTRQSTVGE
jgi:(2R)-sulfolactate sulfo-lyase subunit alpha